MTALGKPSEVRCQVVDGEVYVSTTDLALWTSVLSDVAAANHETVVAWWWSFLSGELLILGDRVLHG